jgi:hypothetical protein
MIRALAAAVAALALGVSAALADPVGKYTVRGSSPGTDRTYEGQVMVRKTGDTYQIVWEIGGQIAVGTGIGGDNFLVVTYLSGRQVGLALYRRKPDGSWEGRWTQLGGRVIENEHWTPSAASDRREEP